MPRRIKSQSHNARPTALLLGAGYCAKAMITPLRKQGYEVLATTRNPEKAARLKSLGVTPIIYNGLINEALKESLFGADIILSSIPPGDNGDPFLNSLGRPLADWIPNAKWVGYLSATSVYGDRQGQWAFEDELLRPFTRRGKNRANAEIKWLETGTPVHVFRLAGIYGKGRNAFSRIKQGKARAVIKEGHVVNRIHVEDIVSVLLASIARPNPLMIYNIADGHPTPPQDVLNYAADLINAQRPPQLDHETADISDMARSFYKETKRIDCSRAGRDLGWTPKYKNYREGLMATLKAERGETETVYLSGYIDVLKADLKSVKLALPAHIRLSQQEPDCTSFHIFQDQDLPTRFHVFETFSNSAAFRRHQDRMKNSEWATISKNAQRHYDVIGLEN
ncbi:antibiotic biosynthesis monooxygenase [Hellea balneolensis]|uniref:antibiotic biosynthesis monooxygenase n=1 Tax=Hellea balneolensis TaxID=287478 RepID=UPI0018F03C83|nr:antibiotic biosynthesis monooxygenase [Hellea balneolensis]